MHTSQTGDIKVTSKMSSRHDVVMIMSFQYGLVSCINHDFRSHIFVGFLCKIIQLLTLPSNIIMSAQRRIYNLLEHPLIINCLTSIDMYNF